VPRGLAPGVAIAMLALCSGGIGLAWQLWPWLVWRLDVGAEIERRGLGWERRLGERGATEKPPAVWETVRLGPLAIALPAERVKWVSCSDPYDHYDCMLSFDGYTVALQVYSRTTLPWMCHDSVNLYTSASADASPFAARDVNQAILELGRMRLDDVPIFDLRAERLAVSGLPALRVFSAKRDGWVELRPTEGAMCADVMLIDRGNPLGRLEQILGGLAFDARRASPEQVAADKAAIRARFPAPPAPYPTSSRSDSRPCSTRPGL